MPLRTYRANVGIALFNNAGQVLIARRLRDDGPEIVLPGFDWQMPQGGIDPGEEIEAAARRELWEETGVVSATILGALSRRIRYDFPPFSGPWHRLSVFKGQEQAWVAMRFQGLDAEVDLRIAGNGAEPEFGEWRWARLEEVSGLVVPFKRHIYRQIAEEFAPFAQPEF